MLWTILITIYLVLKKAPFWDFQQYQIIVFFTVITDIDNKSKNGANRKNIFDKNYGPDNNKSDFMTTECRENGPF